MAASSSMAMSTDLFATTFPFLPFPPFQCRRPSPSRLNSPFPPLSTHRGLSARFHSFQATPCLRRHLLVYAVFSRGGEFESPAGSGSKASESTNSKEAVFDVKLPRRNLLVQFTCNSCGERTQRIINRLAYERGTIFVQCAGCLVNHKLVDNLGLVVEYDLQNNKEA